MYNKQLLHIIEINGEWHNVNAIFARDNATWSLLYPPLVHVIKEHT